MPSMKAILNSLLLLLFVTVAVFEVARPVTAQDVERARATINRLLLGVGSAAAPSLSFAGDTGTGFYRTFTNMIGVSNAGAETVIFSPAATGGVRLGSSVPFGWSSNADPFGAANDTGISRAAAHSIAFGNGTQGDASADITAANVTANGNVSTSNAGSFSWVGVTRSRISSTSDGIVNVSNVAATIGSVVKVDALPTIASGFGTGAAITAGSTALAGSINIGTGGTANTGNINFNGTAFPAAPFCVVTNALSSAVPSQAISSTTQVNIFASSPWVASQVVSWHCISPK